MLQLMFSRRWWWTSILVLVAIGVMVRLGIWQLDRLAARRAFNARVQAQLDQPELNLAESANNASLFDMEYRDVVVRGEYDHSQQVVLRNQAWEGRIGVHLITPLLIEGRQTAVLVDRGWVPQEDFLTGDLEKYAEPGQVEVQGIIRRSQTRPEIGSRVDLTPLPGQRLEAWRLMNIERMDEQISYPLLPVYVQQAPQTTWTRLPYRTILELDLSEGPHLGYAGQWFLFALVLALGYPIYVRQQGKKQASSRNPEIEILPGNSPLSEPRKTS